MRRDGINPGFFYICRSVYIISHAGSGARTHQTIVKHLEQILETEFYFTMFFPVVPSQPKIDCKKKGKRQKDKNYHKLQAIANANACGMINYVSNKKRSLLVRSLAWARFNPASDASTKIIGQRSPITFCYIYFSNSFLLRLLELC